MECGAVHCTPISGNQENESNDDDIPSFKIGLKSPILKQIKKGQVLQLPTKQTTNLCHAILDCPFIG